MPRTLLRDRLDIVFYAKVASVDAHGIGGLQRIVQRQARWLVGAGHRVRVVTSANRHGHSTWVQHGVEYRAGVAGGDPFHIERWRDATIQSWPAILDESRPDIVHGHAEAELGLIRAGLVGAGTGIGVISALYGSPIAGLLDHMRIRAGRRGASSWYAGVRGALGVLPSFRAGPLIRRSRVVALSRRHARMVRLSYAPPRLHVVAPGLDTVLFHPPHPEVHRSARARLGLPSDGFVWGLVGRVAAGKGADLACAALAALEPAPEAPPDHLLIAGTGPSSARLVARAQGAGLADRVHIVGDVEPPAIAYMACDATLFPTDHEESFGLAALESMACGRVVIAAARGAVPEVLGGCGIVIRDRDPDVWAREMARLKAAPHELMQLQVAGRRRAEAHYGRARTMAALHHVYALAIRDAAGSRP